MQNQHFEEMIFKFETTNKTDYRDGEIQPIVKTEYKGKPPRVRPKATPLRNTHTLVDWKDGRVPPFNLFHKPKDLIHIDPRHVQQPFVKTKDEASVKEELLRTRPRLVMTPAVSMDDIADPVARELLCVESYTSEMNRVTRDAARALAPRTNVKAPLPSLPAPANPIILPKLQPPLVSPEWRMETITWDNRQLRGYCEPTAEFWLGQEPIKCRSCDETAIVKAHRKKLRDLKSSKR